MKLTGLCLFATILFASHLTAADAKPCVQSKKRVNACPHMLYRVDKLPSMTKAEMICICISDFAHLVAETTTDAEQISQRMAKRQLEAEFGEDLEVVLQIIKRQR